MKGSEGEAVREAAEYAVDRLEAWMDGEKHAVVSAERRGDRHAAERHYRMVTNYMRLANRIRDALGAEEVGDE